MLCYELVHEEGQSEEFGHSKTSRGAFGRVNPGEIIIWRGLVMIEKGRRRKQGS